MNPVATISPRAPISRAGDAAPSALVARIAPAPFNDRYARVIGAQLSPQLVTSILQQADQGYLWGLADVLEECRERDGHLHCELAKREERVAGAPWELRPPEGSGAKGVEIATWCTARLKEIEATNDLARDFSAAVSDMMAGDYHGRSGHEVIWRREGRWRIPTALEWIHPRRFAYATDWRLHLWDSQGTLTTTDPMGPTDVDGPFGRFPGLALDLFPPGKFLIHRPRIRGTYPTREGLGRLLVWWSTFKRFSVRDLLKFAEWAGSGLRIGTYATGKGPLGENPCPEEDKVIGEQALQFLTSSMWASVPDTFKIDIKDAPHDNDVHERLEALCNGEISKAVLGGTLGAEPGERGARSLGEVQERNELMIARGGVRRVAGSLKGCLLRPMVAYNFGPSQPVPEFHAVVDPKEDQGALAKRAAIFVGMGGELGMDSTREAIGLPAPEGDEPRMKAPAKPAPTADVNDNDDAN